MKFFFNGKPLPKDTEQRMKKENIAMGRGDYHTNKIRGILMERQALRKEGFNVPHCPVGYESMPSFSSTPGK